ncbi:MAG: AraC family transcriptional regulator [Desulfobacterales bacterium]|nr:AraC family transcriptional regulator [Desulfobacterales bacterium]
MSKPRDVRIKNPTTITSWTAVVVQTVESYGYSTDKLLAQAGIDKHLLADPDARIRVEDMRRLWSLAVQMTGDACFGLKAAAHIRPTTFHALGFALMVSSSMMDALERLQRFYRIVSDAIDIDLSPGDDTMTVYLDPTNEEARPSDEAFDMIVAAVVTFARILSPNGFAPLRVDLMRQAPIHPEAFENFFSSPVHFAAAHNRIFFPLRDMHAPLPDANAEIARGNDQIMVEYLARFDKSQVAHQVRAKLIELLPLGEPAVERLARSIGMSTRSLSRYLRKEEVSYREILNDVRRYLSIQYLQQRHLSIIDVAFRLGYSDSSNFTRAFKGWFGLSPAGYRKRGAMEKL